MAPLARFLAAGPPAPTPAELLTEAFRWGEWRTVTKTATVSLHGNLYEVDPALAGARVELVFDPFDLTDIDVHHHDRPAGRAVPFQIGRHVHPKAASTDTAPAPTPTGIDYLRLVEDRHTQSLGERLHYAQLGDPAPPVELLAASQAASEGVGQHPPPDRDGLVYRADLLTPAGNHPGGDPAPVSAPSTANAALDAELASFAALRRADPTDPPGAPDSATPDPEETR
jgi:putative transposase